MIISLRIPKTSWLNRPVGDLWRQVVGEGSAAEGPGPADVVRTAVETARAAGSARDAGRRALGEGVFDLDEMTRRCLGSHAEGRDVFARREFARLFQAVMGSAYRGWMAGTTGRPVLAGGVEEDDRSTVWCTVRTARGSRRIEHRLHRVRGTWLVYDLRIDGMSLIDHYRERLDRTIQGASWDEALWQLRVRELETASVMAGDRLGA